jgi:hypothetical protein
MIKNSKTENADVSDDPSATDDDLGGSDVGFEAWRKRKEEAAEQSPDISNGNYSKKLNQHY